MHVKSRPDETSAIDSPDVATSTLDDTMRFLPYVLAIFFALWGLRGATSSDALFTDAARHAMNGAFIHDLVRDGKFNSPIEYGKYYYAHLPGLSLPYHPPLFPIIESLFFFLFGVNMLAARLAIAVATAVCVLLFYRLIIATQGSRTLALVSSLTFFSLRVPLWVSNEVMLELPTLVFVLGALYCLRDLDRGYCLRRGLLFAILAGAAVWTKQQAVFLGFVPFLYIAFSRRWHLLIGKTVWVSTLLFVVLVVLLMMLSLPFEGTGVNQVARSNQRAEVFLHHLLFYIRALSEWFGLIPAALIAIAFAFFLFAPRHQKSGFPANNLYLAWATAAFLLVLLITPYESRYLFFACPALVVIGYAALLRLCNLILPPTHAWYVPAGVAVLSFALHMNPPVRYLHGPSEAAKTVINSTSSRVLYCGKTNGSFIFAVRSLQPQLQVFIIRGDKLSPATFARQEFENFAHRYGIGCIILERTSEPTPWDHLPASPSPSMVLEREIPMASSSRNFRGALLIYRFTNPSPNPEDSIKVPIPKIRTDLTVEF